MIFKYTIVICLYMFGTLTGLSQGTPQSVNIVEGGSFKDLILPIPITKKLMGDNIWGNDNVLPRDLDNGVEGVEWSYWGGNPILGKDGKYHIAIARWREATGHWGWPKSEVAHAVANSVLGPYKVTGTILPLAHNPEVIELNDGTYLLHVSKGNMYTSKKFNGPWELQGKIKIDQRGHKGLTHLYTNLTGLQRKDGSFLFFTKRGDVMISKTKITGPYEIVSSRNYDRYSGYPEDPVIWKSRYQYHVIFNHAVDKKSVYMRSLDGINWNIEPGEPYDKSVFRYSDGTVNEWCKFERPKVVQDEFGRATNLSLAVIDVEKHLDLGNDQHNSKQVILPLLTERLIEIVNTDIITSNTQEVKIRIKAEKDYNPADTIDIESLRLGVSEAVNFGGGLKPVASKVVKGDLEVTFIWDGSEIGSSNYDLKILGRAMTGEVVFGYALLPQYREDPASLVTLPIKIKDSILYTEVENFGLKKSAPCKLKIFKYFNQKRELLKQFDIKALKAYETYKIKFPVEGDARVEYEALLVSTEEETRFWNKVDDSDFSIVYKGNWSENKMGKSIYFGAEQVATDEGASAAFFFSGTQARCYGRISKEMGSFNVFIDDIFIEKIDCYFGVDLQNMIIYQTKTLPLGLHKLELVATGEHYKGNDKGPVTIDAFSYIE
ncbi:glycoside hydrolase family protein [Zobellia galactanivorans]|uniref:Conserved hypothetical membrane protein n=1 Tax=Zobellia galactanivorans (strain DSM 12802 / CCUG 47099 / CIP 106680 / NCIMB 13871 / Dsij) TaxID=63186 RepID=G0L2L3_ZOBGA|nr:glycoside hydrolase family protein [Zobellia galactanivorans]CAZ95057.1 Conserved hypothetical membrane protein [Zobellia galactanivorans]